MTSINKAFAATECHTRPVPRLSPSALVSPARAGGLLLGEGGLLCKHHTGREKEQSAHNMETKLPRSQVEKPEGKAAKLDRY